MKLKVMVGLFLLVMVVALSSAFILNRSPSMTPEEARKKRLEEIRARFPPAPEKLTVVHEDRG